MPGEGGEAAIGLAPDAFQELGRGALGRAEALAGVVGRLADGRRQARRRDLGALDLVLDPRLEALEDFRLEVDEGGEALRVAVDQGLEDVRRGVEDGLDLLGIDVLAGGAEDHRLEPAADGDAAVFVHHPEVARAEPAVGGEGLGAALRILVVAGEDVGPAGLDLALARVRARIGDAEGHARRGDARRVQRPCPACCR